ncbi:hypothetical protein ABW19_dt0205298 [Dactylella cylindrospora]|nr:hypothetical protein ABW19_dt0205298 [Dactylella cylindrospora]
MHEQDITAGETAHDIQSGIWNSLYNFDRVLSLSTSRISTIPHDTQPLIPSSPASDISLILGKILQATRSPESTPEVLQPLSNELKSFITNLPLEYRWSTILSTNMPQQDLIKSLHINALYFCAIFRLTNTSLFETLKRTTGSPNQLDSFSFGFINNLNYNPLNATYESRWSEAGLYSAQTSLRLFEKAKQNGISLHGTPLFETWLTLTFLISIAGIFTSPSSSPLKRASLSHNSNPSNIESRLSQLSHLYSGLITNARMSPRLCSLSTFINDLRGYLSRRSEDTTCGKDSFEALFGSLSDTTVTSTAVNNIEQAASVAMDTVLDDIVMTPESCGREPSTIDSGASTTDSSEKLDGADESLAGLFPETPTSMTASKTDIDVKEEGMVIDGGPIEQKVVTDVDDLWQKIFEDLDPQEIEPDNMKKVGDDALEYRLGSTEHITALERLIGRTEVFV